ncbi:MAG TPA: carboxypeptidase-like regulatory domain-containing protein [Pyrinomonadaceae bacterium]|nr:carboxypeptidase-like regulatory domain-containing protein [Pyrinomonadaceae bacterium]
MRFPARRTVLLCLLLTLCWSFALAQNAQKQGTAVITGRVMLGDKGLAGVSVAVYPETLGRDRSSVARASTDYEGHYRLSNVPAGRWNIVAIAPALVGPIEGGYGGPGKSITIAEGETVEKIDFTLARGGVITGRVTDADGNPVIGARVNLESADNNNRRRGSLFFANPYMFETDDRGIYRIYGLPPGRYTVSVGLSPDEDGARFGVSSRGYYVRTFHPNVTDQARATIVEVVEGGEASNVDITLGRKAQSFVATGRVLDESGQPVPNVRVGHSVLPKGSNQMQGFGWGSVTDAAGRFRLDGLIPGRYATFVWNEGESGSYSESVIFEISEGDVSGLELKLRTGASISGVAVLEGTADKAALAKLRQLSVGAYSREQAMTAPVTVRAQIAPDGSFNISGLRPGKFTLYLATYPPLKGYVLTRVERDGVTQREIEVTAGAKITGVRVVIEYGTGGVRGIVKVENGELPENMRMVVNARRLAGTVVPGATVINEVWMGGPRGAQVDSRGRFLLEGLPPGEYELTLNVFAVGNTPRRVIPIKKNVSVAEGIESEVTFTYDANAKQPEDGNND